MSITRSVILLPLLFILLIAGVQAVQAAQAAPQVYGDGWGENINPDGSRTRIIGIDTYQSNDGAWHQSDDTISPYNYLDYDYAGLNSQYKTYISSSRKSVRIEYGSEYIAFNLSSACFDTRCFNLKNNGKSVLRNRIIQNAPDFDYNISNSNVLKETFEVQKRPFGNGIFWTTVNDTSALEFIYDFNYSQDLDIYSGGARWNTTTTITTNSSIIIVKGNKSYFALPPGFGVDSNGNRSDFKYRLSPGKITMLVNLSWLKDASYPVIIDPTISKTVSSLSDTWIDESNKDTNHGTDAYIYALTYTNSVRQALLKGDFTSISTGASVTSAKLYMYDDDADGSSNVAQVYLVTGAWNANTVTYNTQPTTGALLDSASVGSNGVWVNWVLTNTVRGWINGSITNNGVRVGQRDAMGANYMWDQFRSSDYADTGYRPYYTVTYTLAAPTTIQHDNFHNTGSTTVLWNAVSGSNIMYDVKVGTASGGSDVINQVGNGLTGSTAATNSNTFTMVQGTTYYYTARDCDGNGCSDWAPERSFTFTNTAPGAPTNILHANYHNSGATVGSWNAVTDSDGDTVTYHYNVGTSSGGTEVYNDQTTTGTSTAIFTMTPNNNYFIKVKSCDTWACSPWNAETSFYYIASPPTPSISVSTGNFYINTSWTTGAGVVIDSFNYSINNTWTNGTTATYKNSTILNPHAWNNVTVYSYNATAGLSQAASVNTQVPNNPITISGILDSYSLHVGDLLTITPSSSDGDNDVPVYATTATKGFFNTNTGVLSWTTGAGETGTYNWQISVTDNNGSTAYKNFSVSVDSQIPGLPLDLNYTIGNFWINYTWNRSVNSNSYNVSQNDTWYNGTTSTYYNSTLLPHGWSKISVQGYNNTAKVTGETAAANNTLPNNAPSIGAVSLSSGSVEQNVIETISADNIIDADGDTMNVSVGITYLGIETNYTMIRTGNTSTYTYRYSSGSVGVYTVSGVYVADTYITTTKAPGLSFLITAAQTGGSSGGGGGGGGGSGSSTATPAAGAVSTPSPESYINIKTLGLDPIGNILLKLAIFLGIVLIFIGLGSKQYGGSLMFFGAIIVIISASGLGIIT